MKKPFIALVAAATVFGTTAYGIPTLQLDASNAAYDAATETTLASSPEFTLFALFNGLTPSGTYYISAALTPATPSGNYGSFKFNGTTVNVTSDMSWGTPTLLPSHDIFPTYYKEFAFTFSTSDNSNRFTNYDVQSVVGEHTGPIQSNTGNSRFAAFSIDLSGLAPETGIHFDLYNYSTKQNGELKIKFAPFSHDAGGNNLVPDGGNTALLIGLGLVCLGLFKGRNAR
ncbi:hypothetical protein ESB00_05350 [Oleiharenicola lentus]|uniref:VPDSG-CTERM sorting domain-containing protein n=1 Tax=Oleiharenicola lentus TaxID=2508720 RepID=A0A4Q1C8P5_9BACT|nr:choice-of-anchor N protein [Oleiharenicola lentus]RXK55325.1 hypothetical protein ESB00_05350 [Oleiharenicola lentus]